MKLYPRWRWKVVEVPGRALRWKLNFGNYVDLEEVNDSFMKYWFSTYAEARKVADKLNKEIRNDQ